MRIKRITYLLIMFFCFSIVSPALFIQPVTAADDPVSLIASQLGSIFNCLTDSDKNYIKSARANLKTITADGYAGSTVWYDSAKTPGSQGILEPVMTTTVVNRFGSASNAKTALIDFTEMFGEIVYPASGNWAAELNSLRSDPVRKNTFHTLFDNKVSVDQMYNFIYAVKEEIPNVIKNNNTYRTIVLSGGNTALKNIIPDITRDAMTNVLNRPAYDVIGAEFAVVGWTPTIMGDFQKRLSDSVDSNGDAQLALLKGYIRTQTKLVNQSNTVLSPVGGTYTIAAGSSIKVSILNQLIPNIGWLMLDSSNTPVTWSKDAQGWPVVPASGTYRLIAYRNYTGADPYTNWVLDASVVAYTPSSGGGGGGGGGSSSGTTVGPNGGTVNDNGVIIEIPANAVNGNIQVKVQLSSKDGLPLPPGSEIVSAVVDITKDKSGDFNKSVTITLTFDPAKVDLSKYDLAIYWFDTATNQWVKLENIKVDAKTGKVSGDVKHFTKFAVIAVPKTNVKPPEILPTTTFADIKGHWAEKSIESLVTAGAITGYSDGTFKPDAAITRAEFVAALVKAFKLTPKGGLVFSDSSQHWAKDYISTAAGYEIVSGYNANKFGPDDLITREQMAVMIVQAAKINQSTVSRTFTDQARISPWARVAVNSAVSQGIMSGYPNNTFAPQRKSSRAEAVTVIVKAMPVNK